MARTRNIFKSAVKYGINFILALAATLGLFLIMVILINTDFKPVAKPNPPSFIDNVKEPLRSPPRKSTLRKKQVDMEKLLEPVSSPPVITFKAKNLKTPPPEYRLTTLTTSLLQKLETQPNFNVNIALPSVAYSGATSANGSSNLGADGNGTKQFGATGKARNAVDICTIAFVLGSDGVSVTELQWIGCRDADISNNAEKALYNWVNEAPKSYRDLRPKAGDTIEFTFERR